MLGRLLFLKTEMIKQKLVLFCGWLSPVIIFFIDVLYNFEAALSVFHFLPLCMSVVTSPAVIEIVTNCLLYPLGCFFFLICWASAFLVFFLWYENQKVAEWDPKNKSQWLCHSHLWSWWPWLVVVCSCVPWSWFCCNPGLCWRDWGLRVRSPMNLVPILAPSHISLGSEPTNISNSVFSLSWHSKPSINDALYYEWQ